MGTVLKKCQVPKYTPPRYRGSPFAVRELAFLTTSFLSKSAVVVISYREERKNPHHRGEGSPTNEKEIQS